MSHTLDTRLTAAVFVGSLGGFVFGFDLGALSAASQSLRAYFELAPWAFGLTISSSVWGTVFGSVFAGRTADRAGVHRLIVACSTVYALTAATIPLTAPTGWHFVLAMRFLCGVAIGGFTVACPLYLAEIAPIHMRGRVVGLFQLQVGAGVIVAFFAGNVAVRMAGPDGVWKWSLGLAAVPAAALLLLARWLPATGSMPSGAAQDTSSPPQVSRAVNALPDGSLFRRQNIRLILVATSVAIFHQLSGVNILLLYMLDILNSAGVGVLKSHSFAVLIACLSLATTLLGMAFVDRLGRKPLLYVGSFGMALCLCTLGLTVPHHVAPLLYVSVFAAYNAFFAFSQGTVVWVYLSELFSPGLRGAGMGYGASVHWIVNAMLIAAFPRVQRASSVRGFYFFAVMMLVQAGVVWIFYPETRGTELGALAAKFNRRT